MHSRILLKPKLLILVGMMLAIFNANTYHNIGHLGFIFILTGALISSNNIYTDRMFKIVVICVLLMCFRLLIQIVTDNWYYGTLRSFMLQMMVFLSIILFRNSRVTLDEWVWVFIRFDIYIVVLASFLFFSHALVRSSYFSTMFGNYLLIAFGMTMILFQLYDSKKARICSGLIMLLLFYYTFISEMRSAVVGEVAGFIYMVYSSSRLEGKMLNRFIFILLMLICFIVPYFYLELYVPTWGVTKELSTWLQRKVFAISNKRLFSGRNIIWLNILPTVKEKLLFGGGFGFTPSYVFDTSLSTHNLFLFIRMEQGLLGLIMFMVLLFEIWNNYYYQKRNNTKYAMQGFILSVLIQQTFSLGLVGGKGAFSIICWCILITLTKREE